MFIHREGYRIILTTLLILAAINTTLFLLLPEKHWLPPVILGLSIIVLGLVLQFFRNPKRTTKANSNQIICPADGKVVVIEEVDDEEFFKERCLQISVFMSPINVHVNRYPVSGMVKRVRYYEGLYLVAWHPKSSTANERSVILMETFKGQKVVVKQIAGAVARRIVYYCEEGDNAIQGNEFGFIKFGSRVDLLLPLGTKVKVDLNQVVRGGETILAEFE
ncbi:MAG: phosphatidylserine decarboxylase family protein [Sphingobacteriales bacterium JAD_PAG50586_3]|nr:MAG: phosphatidylserine decarboxylase family protein [Sphingobacteriales bacterium JAD_PAG50586_3]